MRWLCIVYACAVCALYATWLRLRAAFTALTIVHMAGYSLLLCIRAHVRTSKVVYNSSCEAISHVPCT